MNNIEVYENKEFWKTYNQLYWHNKPNQELSNAAEQISKLLKSDIKQPLYVLSLGLGTGTLELPLLAKIQEYTQRTVRLVGIEQSGTALRVTTKQLSNGLNSLPTETEEMLERIDLASAEENSNSSFWSADNHWLQLDDLDFEPSTNKLFESFPSNWLTRLKENMANDLPHDGFDILISSFCLFHLEWWQHTLIMALSQVKEGGLFLHSHMDGDEHILEGKSTPKIEENRIKALGLCHSSNIAKKVFNTFFAHQDVKMYLTKPRFASAAIPFGILDTLQHFESRGLERLPDVKYLIPSKCSKKDYLSLLETRGFSTFRSIEKNIGGSEAYNEILEDVRNLENTNGSDDLLFDLVWTIYRVETHKLISEPIMQKFLREAKDSSSNIPIDYEYEMKESIRYSPSIRHRLMVEDGNLAEYLIKQLSIAGLLNSSCIGGDVGFVRDLKSPMQYWGFINPLYKPQAKTDLTGKKTFENFAARLAIYLMLIDSNYARQSVGKSLMKELLPYSLTPVAVSYEIISNEGCEDFNVSIELDNYSGYKHLHFRTQIPCSLLKKINLIGEELISKVLEDLDTESNVWIFKSPPSKDYIFDLENLSNIITVTDIETLQYQCIKSIEQLGGVEPIFIEKLKEIISRDNSERNFNVMIWLSILKPHNYVLIIPATYYISDKPVADNLVVLIYDSLQDIEEIKFQKKMISHEVCKMNLLYSQQGISMGIEAAEKRGISGMLHQLPKDLAATHDDLIEFVENYTQFRENPLELEPPLFDLSSLDSLSVSVMIAKCDSEKILYEIPTDCAKILEGEWNTESISNFIGRVVWKQGRQRCISIPRIQQSLRNFSASDFPKPTLRIDCPFTLKQSNGIYPLMIVVLRNTFEHSWIYSIDNPEEKNPEVTIRYCRDNFNETVFVENAGKKSLPKRQTGMNKDVETFDGLTGGWKVHRSRAKDFPIYCDYIQERGIWQTRISREV